MDGDGHEAIGRAAFDSLPEWERQLVEPDLSEQALGKPYLPDSIRTARDKVAFLCCMMDLIYNDECRPYATLPDGRWIPHSPPDANGSASASTGNQYSPAVSAEITALLMGRMVEAVRADDWEEAVRHGGALAHYLREPFSPGHAIHNDLLQELFPHPDPECHVRVHHALDSMGHSLDPVSPRLMGTTTPEAAFRIQIELDHGIAESKRLVARLLSSVHHDEPIEARHSLLRGNAQRAVFVTASAWHTAIAIARERFDESEVAALNMLELTRMRPYFWHHCQYVQLVPGALVKEGRKIPIQVWTPDGEETVTNGFGMGGHMGAKFFVNGDVYTRFRCRVGLASRHTEGQTEFTDTRFMVETDRQLSTVYSEDIEYQATRLMEMPLLPGEPVREVEVDITGARTLILATQTRPYTDPETGQIKFSIPHVAICDPALVRA